MLKITIECEGTGAELREELIAFLGTGTQIVTLKPASTAEVFLNAPTEAEQVVETPVPTVTEKKTRKKANTPETVQVDPENPQPEEPEQSDMNLTLEQDNAEQNKAPEITLEQLTAKALELNRDKKKAECVAILKKYDAESFSLKGSDKPLKPEHYAAVWEELNAL